MTNRLPSAGLALDDSSWPPMPRRSAGHRQPEPHPALAVPSRRARPIEGLEDVREVGPGRTRGRGPRRPGDDAGSRPDPHHDRRAGSAGLRARCPAGCPASWAEQRRVDPDQGRPRPSRRTDPSGRPRMGPGRVPGGPGGRGRPRQGWARRPPPRPAPGTGARDDLPRCAPWPRTSPSTRRYSSAGRSHRRATSTWPNRAVSGVRSWCEASPANRLWRLERFCGSRSSRPFPECAEWSSSSRVCATGRR